MSYSPDEDRQLALDGDWNARLRLDVALPFNAIVTDYFKWRAKTIDKQAINNTFNDAVVRCLASLFILWIPRFGIRGPDFEPSLDIILDKIRKQILHFAKARL